MTETRKQIDLLTKPYWAEGQTEGDITAVFKYIESKSYNLHNEQLDGTLYVHKADGFDAPYLGQILHKPLHLYTEQEEKELLELLQQLQGTNKNENK